jgi:hypothetical protein
MLNAAPFFRYGTKRAGYDLYVNTAGFELRQQLRDFTVANQGIAANEREMQWTVLVDQSEHAFHQLITAFVMKLTQVRTSNVSFLIGVTSGATQRTLPRDLNSERRTSAAQDAFPSLNNFASPHMFLLG